MMANQSQSPLPPLATAAAAAREEVRLWDRDGTIPVSAHVEAEEGLGLEEDNRRRGGKKNHVSASSMDEETTQWGKKRWSNGWRSYQK